MKLYIRVIILVIFTVSFTACIKEQSNNHTLEFYIARATEEENREYILDDYPTFTDKDIKSYDWNKHEIIFTDEYLSQLDSIEVYDKNNSEVTSLFGAVMLGGMYPDKFVVFIDGEELYTGMFEPPAFISFMPSGAVISDTKKGIVINFNNFGSDTDDVRNNDKLYKLLKDRNLLK